jgi:hypothetical protein
VEDADVELAGQEGLRDGVGDVRKGIESGVWDAMRCRRGVERW